MQTGKVKNNPERTPAW